MPPKPFFCRPFRLGPDRRGGRVKACVKPHCEIVGGVQSGAAALMDDRRRRAGPFTGLRARHEAGGGRRLQRRVEMAAPCPGSAPAGARRQARTGTENGASTPIRRALCFRRAGRSGSTRSSNPCAQPSAVCAFQARELRPMLSSLTPARRSADGRCGFCGVPTNPEKRLAAQFRRPNSAHTRVPARRNG